MALPRPMIAYFFVFAGLLLALSVPRLIGFLNQRDDIWWTPKAMAVPLAKSADRVEIYVHGTPLPRLLDSGQVLIKTDVGTRALTSGEIGLRFNNWDRVRAQRSAQLLGYAASAGAGLLMLWFGLIGLFDRLRGKA